MQSLTKSKVFLENSVSRTSASQANSLKSIATIRQIKFGGSLKPRSTLGIGNVT